MDREPMWNPVTGGVNIAAVLSAKYISWMLFIIVTALVGPKGLVLLSQLAGIEGSLALCIVWTLCATFTVLVVMMCRRVAQAVRQLRSR